MRAIAVCVMLGMAAVGCAPMAPEVAAEREACRDWLGAMRIGERPERGSAMWDRALRECTAERLSPAGRIAREVEDAAGR